MIPKSAKRFSDKIIRKEKMIPKKPVPDLIRDAKRFSDKIIRKKERMILNSRRQTLPQRQIDPPAFGQKRRCIRQNPIHAVKRKPSFTAEHHRVA